MAMASKNLFVLNPDMRTDIAVRAVLLGYLDSIEKEASHLVQEYSADGLHDLRVAARKSRAIIKQFRSVIGKVMFNRFAKQFQRLSNLTGPARDMDVYIQQFGELENLLPQQMHQDFEPLLSIIKAHNTHHRKTLINALQTHNFAQFLLSYRQFLTKPVAPRSTFTNARRPIKNVASDQIQHAYARVRKQGDSIKKSSPAESLHSLRKRCKILRYLLESFKQLYNSNDMTNLINTLKELQDNLGGYNDLHVQIVFLASLLEDTNQQTPITKNTKVVIKQLMRQLRAEQKKYRAAFRQTYKHFSHKSNHVLYQQLFKKNAVKQTQQGLH